MRDVGASPSYFVRCCNAPSGGGLGVRLARGLVTSTYNFYWGQHGNQISR